MASVTVATATYVLPECGFTAPANKEFKCWKIYGDTKEYAPGQSKKITSDIKVIAQWKAVSGGSGEQSGGEQSGSGNNEGSSTPAPTPTPSQNESSGGCGSKAVYIFGFGALALGAVIILKRKQF